MNKVFGRVSEQTLLKNHITVVQLQVKHLPLQGVELSEAPSALSLSLSGATNKTLVPRLLRTARYQISDISTGENFNIQTQMLVVYLSKVLCLCSLQVTNVPSLFMVFMILEAIM